MKASRTFHIAGSFVLVLIIYSLAKNLHAAEFPLHVAVQKGDIEVIRELLVNGAQTDQRDAKGNTPLFEAIASENIQVMELLLDSGSNLNVENKAKISPLLLAVRFKKYNAIDLLIDQGAGIDARRIAQTQCDSCHGTNGEGAKEDTPHLAGQHASYTLRQLQAYRDGSRKDRYMSKRTKKLNNKIAEALSKYYESMPPILKEEELSAKPAKGLKKYSTHTFVDGVPTCANCHGVHGMGKTELSIPMIAGQNPEYTAIQLANFREDKRGSTEDGVMEELAKELNDDDIDELAEFIHQLR